MDKVAVDTSPQLIGSSGDSLREAFGKALVELAKDNETFVVFDGDVAGGTGTHHFRTVYPQRFFQCGIAEQNMLAMASGFASTGITPFVTTFGVFCLRAIEQIRLSVAYCQRNVKIVASHLGLDVGPDGASAQVLEDLAMFRSIPNMVVLSPADPLEIFLATEALLSYSGPVYMRTGRSPAKRILDQGYKFAIGKGQILQEGNDVTLIACGVQVARCLEASMILESQNIQARVVNMSTIKPIDKQMIIQCVKDTGCLVTSEDHNVLGGLGSAVAEVVVQCSPCSIEFVGVKDCFGESGEPEELAAKYGLTADTIVDAAKRAIARKSSLV